MWDDDTFGRDRYLLETLLEKHSAQCFYEKKCVEPVEDKLSSLSRVNIALSKLYNSMKNSGVLRRVIGEEDLKSLLALCKETEEIGDANEKEICIVREKIESLRKLQKKVNARNNSTAFIYLERMLFNFQVQCTIML